MLHKVVARENVSFPDMESTTLGMFIHNSLPFLIPNVNFCWHHTAQCTH